MDYLCISRTVCIYLRKGCYITLAPYILSYVRVTMWVGEVWIGPKMYHTFRTHKYNSSATALSRTIQFITECSLLSQLCLHQCPLETASNSPQTVPLTARAILS
jgi:hypothetical protein